MDHNHQSNNVVLEGRSVELSHDVLTNAPSTINHLRRRTNAGDLHSGMTNQKLVQKTLKSPKRIPQWLWNIIAKSLGIKTHSRERPYFSSILHLLTIGSAIRKFDIWNNRTY